MATKRALVRDEPRRLQSLVRAESFFERIELVIVKIATSPLAKRPEGAFAARAQGHPMSRHGSGVR